MFTHTYLRRKWLTNSIRLGNLRIVSKKLFIWCPYFQQSIVRKGIEKNKLMHQKGRYMVWVTKRTLTKRICSFYRKLVWTITQLIYMTGGYVTLLFSHSWYTSLAYFLVFSNKFFIWLIHRSIQWSYNKGSSLTLFDSDHNEIKILKLGHRRSNVSQKQPAQCQK